jgi:hypothetical protein
MLSASSTPIGSQLWQRLMGKELLPNERIRCVHGILALARLSGSGRVAVGPEPRCTGQRSLGLGQG